MKRASNYPATGIDVLDGRIPSDDECKKSVSSLAEKLDVSRPFTLEELAALAFPRIPPENIKTVTRCWYFVRSLFAEIEALHGEEAVRKIFVSFGRQLTAHDRAVRADAKLLWRFLKPPNRNAQKLARELVQEGSSPTYEAALALVKRAKNRKTKRGRAAYAQLDDDIFNKGTDNL